MQPTSTSICRISIFSGRVQGVGFRYTASDLARDFAVTGYVKNLRDGGVELLAEGEPDEIDRFLATVRERMRGNIRDVKSRDCAAQGTYRDFIIRYD